MQFKKLERIHSFSRLRHSKFSKLIRKKFKIVNSITINISNPSDRRPHAMVEILGIKLIGLLDSGSTVTILGKNSEQFINDTNLQLHQYNGRIKTADGTAHSILGYVNVPYFFDDQYCIVPTLIVPTLTNNLILGWDFWESFNIVPSVKALIVEQDDLSEEHITTKDSKFHTLTSAQDERLSHVIKNFPKSTSTHIGCTHLIKHKIETPSIPPGEGIRVKPYKMSPYVALEVNKEIDKLLDLGIISKCDGSPWCLPVIAVKKPNGTIRLCFDARQLNKVTKKDTYPMPYITRILSNIPKAKYFSTIDLSQAFFQVPLDAGSKEKTCFSIPGKGLFQHERMPMGAVNSACTQARLMDKVLGPELEPNIFSYLDDIVVMSESFEQHVRHLETVSKRLRNAGLTIGLEKSKFCLKEILFCGFIINSEGKLPNPDKIKPILDFPKPDVKKKLKSFLGMCTWFLPHIPNFAETVRPLHDLLKGKYVKSDKIKFNEQANEAFLEIKKKLTEPSLLSHPDYSLPFTIAVDSSNFACGGIIYQDTDEGER